jgi:hypothetical protein
LDELGAGYLEEAALEIATDVILEIRATDPPEGRPAFERPEQGDSPKIVGIGSSAAIGAVAFEMVIQEVVILLQLSPVPDFIDRVFDLNRLNPIFLALAHFALPPEQPWQTN